MGEGLDSGTKLNSIYKVPTQAQTTSLSAVLLEFKRGNASLITVVQYNQSAHNSFDSDMLTNFASLSLSSTKSECIELYIKMSTQCA